MSLPAVVHAFRDDALGDLDAVGVADRIQRGEVSTLEVALAAVARAAVIEPALHPIALSTHDAALAAAGQRRPPAPFAGVPTYLKDNTDLKGWPTRQGSLAVGARPAKTDGAFARQFLAQGFIALGKSTLPEFGLNASTEFATGEPTRNPWQSDRSCGASSGGAAVLVASGVVPIAHANDGGGSIRIPAACCGLVGLKPTRGRLLDSDAALAIPHNIIAEGVLTRSVRDTAHFFAHAEQYFHNPKLPAIGLVQHPAIRRLRVGVFADSVTGHVSDDDTKQALIDAARLLENLGHEVHEIPPPVTPRFASDFSIYWGMLTFLLARFGRHTFGPDFDASRLDPFSRGLVVFYKKNWARSAGVLYRLKRAHLDYARRFEDLDVVMSPVLAHVAPPIGYLSPTLPFDELFDRLHRYVSFTPWNNAAGGPAISLPMGHSTQGLPIGIHFSAAHGQERTLLELALELEQASPWRKIQALDPSQRHGGTPV